MFHYEHDASVVKFYQFLLTDKPLSEFTLDNETKQQCDPTPYWNWTCLPEMFTNQFMQDIVECVENDVENGEDKTEIMRDFINNVKKYKMIMCFPAIEETSAFLYTNDPVEKIVFYNYDDFLCVIDRPFLLKFVKTIVNKN